MAQLSVTPLQPSEWVSLRLFEAASQTIHMGSADQGHDLATIQLVANLAQIERHPALPAPVDLARSSPSALLTDGIQVAFPSQTPH